MVLGRHYYQIDITYHVTKLRLLTEITCQVQEMITYSMVKHVRRFCISCVVFGFSIMLIVWAPLTFINAALPGVIPYSVEMSTGIITIFLLLCKVIITLNVASLQVRY